MENLCTIELNVINACLMTSYHNNPYLFKTWISSNKNFCKKSVAFPSVQVPRANNVRFVKIKSKFATSVLVSSKNHVQFESEYSFFSILLKTLSNAFMIKIRRKCLTLNSQNCQFHINLYFEEYLLGTHSFWQKHTQAFVLIKISVVPAFVQSHAQWRY